MKVGKRAETNKSADQPIRVVVADDHRPVLRGNVEWLRESAEFEVVGTAFEPGEAVQACERLRPDVAVVDLIYNHVECPELPRRIKAVSERTLVVVYSGFTAPSQVHSALLAGADGYFSKDPRGLDLPEVVRLIFRGNVVLDPKILSVVEIDDGVSPEREEIMLAVKRWHAEAELLAARRRLGWLTDRQREILSAKANHGKDVVACRALGLKSDEDFKNRMAMIRERLRVDSTEEALRLYWLANPKPGSRAVS